MSTFRLTIPLASSSRREKPLSLQNAVWPMVRLLLSIPANPGGNDHENLKQILMHRDGMSADEAEELIQEAREAVAEGQDPEEVCYDYFGLEPDYVWELL